MSVKLLIPTALQQYTGNQDEIEVSAKTVRDALQTLAARSPDLQRQLFDDQGRLRAFVNVYVGDQDMRSLQGLDTPVQEGAELSIVPSIAGGVGVLEPDAAEETKLDKDELLRYSRHIILPEVGMEGQKKLKAARVLCIGAGGLGAPLAMYLAAAGVGTLGMVDFDVVDVTNLQRQVIHGTEDVGRSKLESARETVRRINPFVNVIGFETRLTSENALEIFRDFDVIVDGTDNFPTRYLVNDACVLLGKPNVYGSILRFEGQASVFWAAQGPCYRCLYPEPPPPGLVPSCAEGGVLGVLPGVIGTIQAIETVKLILGIGEPLIGRLLLLNALKMRWRELKLRKDPNCPICGEHPTIDHLIDYEQFCGIRPPVQAPIEEEVNEMEMSVRELKRRIDEGTEPRVIDVREPYEWEIARIPGATLIPLGELPERYRGLNPEEEIVLHCRTGMRSARAQQFLRSQGFKHVRNLKGGIQAWADEIDPNVPKY